MTPRLWLPLLLLAGAALPCLWVADAPACCPVTTVGKPVVNADQSVIIIWDAVNKVQHFIRRASFQSDAADFGFVVPSPTQPELSESGNEAFPYLQKLTEPEIERKTRPAGGGGCGCAKQAMPKDAAATRSEPSVTVLEQKVVAGFNAAVLEASSANALVGWLKENGFAFSPEVEAWARPYVEAGWKFTALRLHKADDEKEKKTVAAGALRMTFKTDRPLFPYREPDPKSMAEALNARSRLLRIYFVADARYKGELTPETAWSGKVAWANKLNPEQRNTAISLLKLPENTGPAQWWLTEFEDNWAYKSAPADVYFSRDDDQSTVKRPPIVIYVSSAWPMDVAGYAIAAMLVVPPVLTRVGRRRGGR
jgi:hypothetical protein